AVRLDVGRGRAAPPHGGKSVPLTARDLRVEDAEQGLLQVLLRRGVKYNLVLVAQPVEVAPYLAAVQVRGPLLRGQAADRRDHAQGDRHVRRVLVGEVVGVDD